MIFFFSDIVFLNKSGCYHNENSLRSMTAERVLFTNTENLRFGTA